MATQRSNLGGTLYHVFIPIAVILLLLVGSLYWIRSETQRVQQVDETREGGNKPILPDFSLNRLDGSSVRLSEIPGKVFLVSFWATWCEACTVEIPSIIRLKDEFRDRGFEVLGINLDENPSVAVPRIIKKLALNFPVFQDPKGDMAAVFDVRAIPFAVVMDRQRRVLAVKDGEQDWSSPKVKNQVNRWLSE